MLCAFVESLGGSGKEPGQPPSEKALPAFSFLTKDEVGFVNDYFLGIDRKREYIETIQSHVNDGICAINACIQADICHDLYGEVTT